MSEADQRRTGIAGTLLPRGMGRKVARGAVSFAALAGEVSLGDWPFHR